MIIKQKIKGERLHLRSIYQIDANINYVQWLNDNKVNKFLETRFVKQNLQSIEAFIESKNKSDNEYLLGIFANQKTHIGNLKIGPIRKHHRLAELSIFIGDKTSWGKGYASEAIIIASSFASEYLKLRKLTASIYEDNIGSILAFTKAGWSKEAKLSNHYLIDGHETDLVIMSKSL